MADDLDEFLRQAAERKKNRQQQKNARPPLQTPPATPPVAKQIRDVVPTLTPSSSDAYERPNAPSTPTLSSLPPVLDSSRSQPTREPFEAARDSNRTPYDSSRSNAKPKKGNKKGNASQRLEPPVPEPRPVSQLTASAEIVPVTQVSQWGANSIAAHLRDPNSVRTAIILHEVLKRPWE